LTGTPLTPGTYLLSAAFEIASSPVGTSPNAEVLCDLPGSGNAAVLFNVGSRQGAALSEITVTTPTEFDASCTSQFDGAEVNIYAQAIQVTNLNQ